ncbi:uncharacterized protein [Dysidea avara]|uniref:uncharacterized protein n=1 Tax=Dysidea avara TaxID=196820 RepID=UPI00332FE7F1
MESVLRDLNFSDEVVERFKEEKVFVSTIPLLTDSDFSELGIKTMGQRAMLKKRCCDISQGKKVASEVRRIMGPAIPSTSYSLPMHSITNFGTPQLPRRSKQKGKYSATAYNRSKKTSVSFQKRIYVFGYMGEDPPKKFTRCDKDIYLSGLLPSLSTNATEKEVREEICALIHSSSGSISISVKPTDFEFINMCGKQASVVYCKEGFHWDGRAVKELSGSGGVYVRLTKNISTETSSSDEELPEGPFQCYHTSSSNNQSHGSRSNISRLVTCSSPSCGEDLSHSVEIIGGSLSRSGPSHIKENIGSSSGSRSCHGRPCREIDDLHLSADLHSVAHDRPRESSDDSLASQRDNSGRWLVDDAGNDSNLLPLSTLSSGIPGGSGLGNTGSTNTLSRNDSMTYGIHSSSQFRNDGDSTMDVSHSTSSMDGCQPAPYVINLVADENSDCVTPREVDRYTVSSPVTSSSADIANLQEIFPDKSLGLLKFVLELCSCSFLHAVEFLTSVTSFSSLRSLAAESLITTPLDESPRIRLDDEDEYEDWLTAALAFYKYSKFDKHAAVRITIHGQPGVDAGGVRRQFFSIVFTQLVKPSATSLFEGEPCRLCPAYKATSLSSGLLRTVGTMVAHSILLDGQGFPFLAEYCYHYLTGNEDLAITAITSEDVSMGIKDILQKLENVETEDELLALSREEREELCIMMEKSGCDLPLTVGNKKCISECIILYDALYKRKIYLDAFASGLEVLGMQSMIMYFPDQFKAAFVFSESLTGDAVIAKLKPVPKITRMSVDEYRIWCYLLSFLHEATEEDLKAYVRYVTGSPNLIDTIHVKFVSYEGAEAISSSTCHQRLTLSTNIQGDEEEFCSAMKAVVHDLTFTMP